MAKFLTYGEYDVVVLTRPQLPTDPDMPVSTWWLGAGSAQWRIEHAAKMTGRSQDYAAGELSELVRIVFAMQAKRGDYTMKMTMPADLVSELSVLGVNLIPHKGGFRLSGEPAIKSLPAPVSPTEQLALLDFDDAAAKAAQVARDEKRQEIAAAVETERQAKIAERKAAMATLAAELALLESAPVETVETEIETVADKRGKSRRAA